MSAKHPKGPFDADGPEKRARIMADVHDILKTQFGFGKESPETVLVDRAKEVSRRVMERFHDRHRLDPMLVLDKKRASAFLSDQYLGEFRTWSKEELLFLISMLHVELALENM